MCSPLFIVSTLTTVPAYWAIYLSYIARFIKDRGQLINDVRKWLTPVLTAVDSYKVCIPSSLDVRFVGGCFTFLSLVCQPHLFSLQCYFILFPVCH